VSKKTEYVLVEAVSMFRTRYLVEVPVGKSEYALDTVTLNEAKTFSSEHLDDTIVNHRIISKKKALELCDIDNQYAASWSDDHKVKVFFTRETDIND
jgi:hypothetical protein